MALRQMIVLVIAMSLATVACKSALPTSADAAVTSQADEVASTPGAAVAPGGTTKSQAASDSEPPTTPEGTPVPPPDLARVEALAGSQSWYGVYFMGKKCGWAHEHFEKVPAGIRMAFDAEISFARMGMTMAMTIDSERVYAMSAPFELVSLEEHMVAGPQTMTFTGAKGADGFELTTGAGTSATTTKVPQPKETLADVVAWLQPAKMQQGIPYATVRFDTMKQADVAQTTTITGTDELTLKGVPTVVYTLETKDEGFFGATLVSKSTADGTLVEADLMDNLHLVLETEEAAKDMTAGVPDLFDATFVPASQAIAEPSAVTKSVLVVKGLAVDDVPPSPFVTATAAGDDSVRLTIVASSLTAKVTSPSGSPDPKDNLGATSTITSTDEAIVAKAAELVAGLDTEQAKVEAIVTWVSGHMQYDLKSNPFTARAILDEGKGDCSEHALLATALLRAAGVPARQVYGLVPSSKQPPRFGFHAWVEVWLGDAWYPVDPTWKELAVDASHLPLAGDTDVAIIAKLGKLEIVVEAAE